MTILFEYEVKKLNDENLDDLKNKLNKLGSEGWKLVCCLDDEIGIFERQSLYSILPIFNTINKRSDPTLQPPTPVLGSKYTEIEKK